jgi:hypothetical protein
MLSYLVIGHHLSYNHTENCQTKHTYAQDCGYCAQGDYLAVKVDRYTKTKKSTYTGFELFSIRDKVRHKPRVLQDVLQSPRICILKKIVHRSNESSTYTERILCSRRQFGCTQFPRAYTGTIAKAVS